MLSTALPAQVAQLVEQRTENPCASQLKPAAPLRRQSPGAVALGDHARHCSKCLAVAIAGQPPTKLCPAGRILAIAAIRARAQRAA